jgi:hypothetical protein
LDAARRLPSDSLELVDRNQHRARRCWLRRDTEAAKPLMLVTRHRAMTVIFFEYTGGLCGICMSSPISSCNVCLPGGS